MFKSLLKFRPGMKHGLSCTIGSRVAAHHAVSKSTTLSRCYAKAPLAQFSRGKEKACQDRKRMYSHFRELFKAYLPQIKEHVLSADLNYTVQVAQNVKHFKIEDKKLTMDLLNNDMVTGQDSDVYHMLYKYAHENYFRFSRKQLQSMEDVYFTLSNKVLLDFFPVFEPELKEAASELALDAHIKTKLTLNTYNVHYNKELVSIALNKYENTVNIRFKDSGKQLALYGGSHLNIDSIRTAREKLTVSPFDVYIFEQPPITLSEVKKVNRGIMKINNDQDEVAEALKFLQSRGESGSLDGNSSFWGYLRKYEELPLMTPKDLQIYFDEYIAKSPKFQINASERIVYTVEDYLRMPYDPASILYHIHMRKGLDYRVVFADVPSYSEFTQAANKMTLKQVQKLFEYARVHLLNEKVRWAISVNKKGCQACSKSHTDPPFDIFNLMSHHKYDFSIREKGIADKIFKSLRYLKGDTYMAYLGDDHVFPVLKYLLKLVEGEENPTKQRSLESKEALVEQFLTQQPEAQATKQQSETERKEFIQKFAMLASFYQEKYDVPIPAGMDLDRELYHKYLKAFSEYLTTDSFEKGADIKYKWTNELSSCYAKQILVNK